MLTTQPHIGPRLKKEELYFLSPQAPPWRIEGQFTSLRIISREILPIRKLSLFV
jgi:hypothetical protein